MAGSSFRRGRVCVRRWSALLTTPALALAVVASTSGGAQAVLAVDEPATAPSVTSSGVETDLDAIIEQLRREVGEGNETMIRAGADLRLAEAALPNARATAEEATRLLAAALRQKEQSAQLRGQAQVQLMLAERQAEQSAAAVAQQQVRVGRLARQVYQSGGDFQSISVLLESTSPADFANRLVTLQTLASSQQSTLQSLEIVESSYGDRAADLEQVRDALAVADERAQQELATVSALEVRARAASETVGRLVQAREAALAAVQAASAEDEIAAARRESASSALGAMLAGQARNAGVRGDGSGIAARPGTLTRPVAGSLSSPFGMRTHPITGVYKLHTGADFSAACGTPILAARDGVVIDAGWNSAYGWRTVVSHGKVRGVLLTTTYNHQPGLDVAVGDDVAAGQVIGRVGSTGYSTGCHLHFELYVNTTLVDPMPWIG